MKESEKMLVKLIIIVIIAEIIIFIVQEEKLKKNKRIIQEYEKERYLQNNIKEYNTPYHRVNLLTQNEYLFYERLKKYVYPHGLQILAKIRLADLVNVNKGINKSEWGAAFSRISSKHIDFAIAKDMKVLIIIELDDSSHGRNDRKTDRRTYGGTAGKKR